MFKLQDISKKKVNKTSETSVSAANSKIKDNLKSKIPKSTENESNTCSAVENLLQIKVIHVG